MKILVLNESKQSLGGGWSFIANFIKGLPEGSEITQNAAEADIVFIPSATMVSRDVVSALKDRGKKIVLRLDNIPRNSRNRGCGTTRLYDIAQMADLVIYQSLWAYDYLFPWLKKDGPVIYNGVDIEIFKPEGPIFDFKHGFNKKIYLYSRYNRDETKGWERVWWQFQQLHRQTLGGVKLVIAGRFSEELKDNKFDFFMDEDIEYIGVIEDPKEMAKVYRGCDVLLAPYFNDCYSNTILEALSCGLELDVEMSGGTPELLKNGVRSAQEMAQDYIEAFKGVLNA